MREQRGFTAEEADDYAAFLKEEIFTRPAMKETTDAELAEIRAASCSVLVQKLVKRLDRVEENRKYWTDTANVYERSIEERDRENTALRERVKRMEAALKYVWSKLYADDYCDWALMTDFDSNIVQAALKEGE